MCKVTADILKGYGIRFFLPYELVNRMVERFEEGDKKYVAGESTHWDHPDFDFIAAAFEELTDLTNYVLAADFKGRVKREDVDKALLKITDLVRALMKLGQHPEGEVPTEEDPPPLEDEAEDRFTGQFK